MSTRLPPWRRASSECDHLVATHTACCTSLPDGSAPHQPGSRARAAPEAPRSSSVLPLFGRSGSSSGGRFILINRGEDFRRAGAYPTPAVAVSRIDFPRGMPAGFALAGSAEDWPRFNAPSRLAYRRLFDLVSPCASICNQHPGDSPPDGGEMTKAFQLRAARKMWEEQRKKHTSFIQSTR